MIDLIQFNLSLCQFLIFFVFLNLGDFLGVLLNILPCV